jgi:hypothetical protein
LIVADLTNGNENVFYEVGVAHALNKPTILMTQQLDELPFDLRAYRTIGYSTHFSRIDVAKARLTEFANAALNTPDTFGNPVSDYFKQNKIPLPLGSGAQTEKKTTNSDFVDANNAYADESLGLIDYAAQLEEEMHDLTVIITESSDGMVAFNDELTSTLEASPLNTGTSSERRNALKKLASHMRHYAGQLNVANKKYKDKLSKVDEAVMFLLEFSLTNHAHEDPEALTEFLATMNSLQLQATSAQGSLGDLLTQLRSLPRLQKDFNIAKRSLADELEQYIENILLTAAMAERASSFGK